MIRATYSRNICRVEEFNPDSIIVAVSSRIPRFDFDIYAKVLAPSSKLMADWIGQKITFEEFTRRYKAEMDNCKSKEVMQALKEVSEKTDVILVCSSKKLPCHRLLLLEMVKGSGQP